MIAVLNFNSINKSTALCFRSPYESLIYKINDFMMNFSLYYLLDAIFNNILNNGYIFVLIKLKQHLCPDFNLKIFYVELLKQNSYTSMRAWDVFGVFVSFVSENNIKL
jgi:hypothetical protein